MEFGKENFGLMPSNVVPKLPTLILVQRKKNSTKLGYMHHFDAQARAATFKKKKNWAIPDQHSQ
jgi:hypothetical protein